MRLPNDAHTSQPWRIHEIAPDFRLEDVWALPTPGGRGRLRAARGAGRRRFDSPSQPVVRALFAIRWKLGAARLDAATGLGATLRRCATACRRTCATTPPAPTPTGPFTPLY